MPARNEAEVTAERYYDSSDADSFYEAVWGGEDIHIGLYQSGLSIAEASRRTVRAMCSQLQGLGPRGRVLDLGAGYGGSARYLAREIGCRVTCLNLSEVQNERNRTLCREQGLAERVEVLHGSFEAIPGADARFDVVWSQDAFLHGADRVRVLEEIQRVLKPGGELIFTDPMQADDCPPGVLQPVYDRLELASLASPRFYRRELRRLGFEEVQVSELVAQLRTHYASVKRDLESRYPELSTRISRSYLDRMIRGLGHWVAAADQGYLAWGILHFRKPGTAQGVPTAA